MGSADIITRIVVLFKSLGIKPGYMQEVTDKGVKNVYSVDLFCMCSFNNRTTSRDFLFAFSNAKLSSTLENTKCFLVCRYFALQRTFT